MRLWSTLERVVFENTLGIGNIYRCCESKCDMLKLDYDNSIKKAYDWLSGVMREKLGEPPLGVKYPVWAWYRLRGNNSRPDLRWVEFRHSKVPMVLMELEIQEDRVLLSDEELWTCGQLNNSPCFGKRDDNILDTELNWYYDEKAPSCVKEEWKLSTWHRVFEVESSENVQGTFWSILPSDIVSVKYYNNQH